MGEHNFLGVPTRQNQIGAWCSQKIIGKVNLTLLRG